MGKARAAALPYDPQHLDRTDAIGGRAKREAINYWHAEVRKCGRRLADTEIELESLDKNKKEKRVFAPYTSEDRERLQLLLTRRTHWRVELVYAKQKVEELKVLVRGAWK